MIAPVRDSDGGAEEGEGETAGQSAQRKALHSIAENSFAAQNRQSRQKANADEVAQIQVLSKEEA